MEQPVSPIGDTPPGSRFPLIPGVRSHIVISSRLRHHVYESGLPGAEPIVLVHGNASSARFYEQLLARLAGHAVDEPERTSDTPSDAPSPSYYVVAPDLRGYGASEPKVVDATHGLGDFADDLAALVDALQLERFHLVGWSLGGNIAMQFTIDHPERVKTLFLEATGSPFGYGCTHGAEGTLNVNDYAGSGAGLINPDLVARIQAKDETASTPFTSRSVMRHLYVKTGFAYDPQWEDALVEQINMMQIGEQFYPGDSVASPNWPFKGPGISGANNALSPKYCDLTPLAAITPKPPILWVHGADDLVVSDAAMVDPGALGKLGLIPGWPGEDVYPPQPMLAQIRQLLGRYAANEGQYREEILPNCGHSPHIEHPEAFIALLEEHIRLG